MSSRKRLVTEQTLSDQLQITEREVGYRKSLLMLSEDDVTALLACKPTVTASIDAIVDEFYRYQVEVSEIALLIGDADTLQRLSSSMRGYILDLFEGQYDSEYVNKRLRIGKVHKRIGVSPKLFISAIVMLERVIEKHLCAAEGEAGESAKELIKQRSLNKLLMFDVQFVFDTYISSLVAEVDAAKIVAEEHAENLEEIVAQRTAQLAELSRTDPLTRLHNIRSFYEHLRRELSASERHQRPLSLIYLDLNGFKHHNDTYGHSSGNAVLSEVGDLLRREVRAEDTACRYGGDEFTIILPSISQEQAMQFGTRLLQAFREAKALKGIGCSIGIATTDCGRGCDADTLVHHADAQMYIAKRKKDAGEGPRISAISLSAPPAPSNGDAAPASDAPIAVGSF